MTSDDVTAALAFNLDVRGGIEPAGPMVEMRVTSAGFFETGGLGAAGQSLDPIAPARVAETLVQHFEPARLRVLLDHLVALRDALPHADPNIDV